MQVKLINQALRRVVIPEPELHTVAAVEAFKAGVRALAYELEKDTTPDYTGDMLDEISKSVGVDVSGKNCTTAYAEFLRKTHSFTLETTPGAREFLQKCADEQPAYSLVPTESLITFTDELAANIRKVFDNEASFLAKFMPDDIGVEEFYVSDERCFVVTAFCDRRTVKTADFLAWAEGLTAKAPPPPYRYDWKGAPDWAERVVKLDTVHDMLYWHGQELFAAVNTPHITFSEWAGECDEWEARP